MEVKVNIPLNDWKETSDVRQEVVQGICDTFLSKNVWSMFHPVSNGVYRRKTIYIYRHKNETKFKGFTGQKLDNSDVYVRFNSFELKTAVKCLQNAGYYFHEVYEYNTWLGYVCSKYPTIEKGHKVDNIRLTSDF